jgi:hypothetical protein
MLEQAFRGVKGWTYKPSDADEPEPPAALHEPNDMIIVAPPCHSWEPVKVLEEAASRGVLPDLREAVCGAIALGVPSAPDGE